MAIDHDDDHGADGAPDVGAIRGMDPRAHWLCGAGCGDYVGDRETTFVPFLVDRRLPEDADGRRGVVVPRVSRAAFEDDGAFYPAFARLAFFDAWARGEGGLAASRDAPKTVVLSQPRSDAQPAALGLAAGAAGELAEPAVGPPEDGWPPGTVVVGVVDDAVAFAHDRFRAGADRTRVEAFWQMDGPAPADLPRTVELGWETTRRDGPPNAAGERWDGIDTRLRTRRHGRLVDEDRIYAEVGNGRFGRGAPYHAGVAFRVAHGTHVLDVAAGADPRAAVADRPIVAVQLPATVTAATSGTLLAAHLTLAVDYILDRARRLAGPHGPALPVVVNVSYGYFAGPHDGRDPIERMLDERIARYERATGRPLRITLPAGNGHAARCHAAFRAGPSDGVVELRWRLPPDDRTATSLQLWLPAGAIPRPTPALEVALVAPDGTTTSFVGEAATATARPITRRGRTIGAIGYRPPVSPADRGQFVIELCPTARVATAGPVAPSGLWRVRIRNRAYAGDAWIRAWIQRDDNIHGYPRRGRQSYFDEPSYERFDPYGRPLPTDVPPLAACPIRRAGMTNAIATGAHTLVAGGYRRREGDAAPYAAGAAEPEMAAAPRTPDAAGVSDHSRVHGGIVHAGARSGSRVALAGTSVAAPKLARWAADRLAAGGTADRAELAEAARIDDLEHYPAGPPLDGRRLGEGRMRIDDVDPPRGRLRRFDEGGR